MIPKAERDADAAILAAATPDWRPGAVEKWHLYCRATHPERLNDERVLMRANEHFPYEADVVAAAHSRNRLPVYIEAAAETERRIEKIEADIARRDATDRYDDQRGYTNGMRRALAELFDR